MGEGRGTRRDLCSRFWRYLQKAQRRSLGIAAVQKRPLVKAALFSANINDFSRFALLRAYEKEPRLIAAVDHIARRLAQRSGPSGLRGTEPTAAKSHN